MNVELAQSRQTATLPPSAPLTCGSLGVVVGCGTFPFVLAYPEVALTWVGVRTKVGATRWVSRLARLSR